MKNNHVTAQKSQRGFTLIELMMVLAVFGIIMAIAGPSFVSVWERNAQTAAMNIYVAGIRATRAHAVTNKRTTLLSPLDGDWNNGFQIIQDNLAGAVISQHSLNDSNVTITSSSPMLTFDLFGRANPNDTNFIICNTDVGRAATIRVSFFGNTNIDRRDNIGGEPDFTGC